VTSRRLSRQDASFLAVESPSTHMHGGGIMLFDRPVSYEEFFDDQRRRLPRNPRARQRIANVPFSLHRPLWVDDTDFDLSHHIRRIALPSPGTEQQLLELASFLLSTKLDPRRPLWERWVVEGVAGGRGAIIGKEHHVIADGMSQMSLLNVYADHSETEQANESSSWTPSPVPSRRELMAEALRDRVEDLRSVARRLREPKAPLGARAREAASQVRALVRSATDPGPSSILNQANGPTRLVAAARAPLDDFRSVRHRIGGTINDGFLTVVSLGLRSWMRSRGLDTDGLTLRAVVPVSVRDQSAGPLELGNRVANLFAPLPLHEADPMAVHRIIADAMQEAKQTPHVKGIDHLQKTGSPRVLALMQRIPARMHVFNVVVSNVMGPPEPIWFAGSKVTQILPFAQLGPWQAVGVAAMSYAGEVYIGVTADAQLVPDAGTLAEAIEKSVRDLREAAART
jgi:WS/DGAT/MGAT family acyltransferase